MRDSSRNLSNFDPVLEASRMASLPFLITSCFSFSVFLFQDLFPIIDLFSRSFCDDVFRHLVRFEARFGRPRDSFLGFRGSLLGYIEQSADPLGHKAFRTFGKHL